MPAKNTTLLKNKHKRHTISKENNAFFGDRFFFKKRYRIHLIIISNRFSFIVKEKSGSKRVQRKIAEKCVRATFSEEP